MADKRLGLLVTIFGLAVGAAGVKCTAGEEVTAATFGKVGGAAGKDGGWQTSGEIGRSVV
jgi:hypothetical protein